MSVPGGANLQAPIASLTSKVKEALSVNGAGSAQRTDGVSKSAANGSAHMNRALPPNFTAEQLDAALDAFREIVGSGHVDVVDLDKVGEGSYMDPPKTHDAFYMLDKDDLVVSAIVRPGSTEDVQAIMKAANQHKVPLWVTSIGRNVGYGGAARTLFLYCKLIQPVFEDLSCLIWEQE